MTYYDLIKEHGNGKGDATMWASTARVSEFVETVREDCPQVVEALLRDTYALLCGEHYNECYATERIAMMTYKDERGNVHHVADNGVSAYRTSYEQYKGKIKDTRYNCWDWAVTVAMMFTDYHEVLRKWFPSSSDEELRNKAAELALAYLNDDDDCTDGKTWRRFNG